MTGHPLERLSALLDNELPPAERTEVEGHLRECAACARHLEELAAVDALARDTAVEAPPGYFDTLPGRVRARLRGRRRVAPLALWSSLAAAAAVVMAAVLVPVTLTRQGEILPPPAPAPAASLPEPAIAEEALDVRPLTPAPVGGATAPPARAKAREADGDAVGGRAGRSAPEGFAGLEGASPSRPASRDEGVAPRLQQREAARGVAPAGTAPPPPQPAAATATPAAVPAPMADAAASRRAEKDAAPPAAPPTTVHDARREAGRREQAVLAQATAPEEKEDQAGAAAAPAAGAPAERRDRVAGFQGGNLAAGPDARFQALAARTAATAAEARALHRAFSAFAAEHSAHPRADEARVRAVEAAVQAWRLGGEERDLEAARAAARAYLAAPRAPQAERVRRALATLPPASPAP